LRSGIEGFVNADRAFDHVALDGIAGEAGDFMDIELVHDLLPVFFDGLDADAQFGSDLFIGVAFGDELEGLGFAACEARFFPGLIFSKDFLIEVAETRSNLGAESGFAFEYLTDGLEQFGGSGFFEEITAGAASDGAAKEFIVVVGRENEHAGSGAMLADLAQGFKAVQARHNDIEHNNIGFEGYGLFDGLATIGCFSDDLYLRVVFEESSEPLTYDLMVVRE
jgi:hypothetical protein